MTHSSFDFVRDSDRLLKRSTFGINDIDNDAVAKLKKAMRKQGANQ